ncbi:MAG TPA: DUF1707 domain-containing protein [Streptosporangiaceae bacterium]|nr:DUF1707 domain-containing protein [Streptosporangiaceae bacterium]
MATGPDIRVGDAEREAVAAQLREHYGDGRLTLDELNERLDQTFAAKTVSELGAVTTDLPRDSSAWAPGGGVSAGSKLSVGPQGDGPQGDAWNSAGGRMAAAAAPLVAMVAIAGLWILVMFGGIFGPGGRPFGIVLLIAVFAFIRKMFRGGRGGRGGGCGRRW